VGVAAGIETKAAKQDMGAFSAFNPNLTVIVGKNITPIFGIRTEGVLRFNAHKGKCKRGFDGKAINALDVNALATININNLIWGYQGQPRNWEFIALYGFGWTHSFNTRTANGNHLNALNSKAGIDVAYNFGNDKQWQLFVEPSITYMMTGYNGFNQIAPTFQYNLNRANLDLKVGLVYKFPCSNGTHNFKTYDVGGMNETINDLRSKLAEKPETITVVKQVVVKETAAITSVNNEKWVVTFDFNSAELTEEAKFILNQIGENAIVDIVATASPEGSEEYNLKLSERRANAVKDYLTNKGVKVNSAVGKGIDKVSGKTAVVTPTK
jgi:outer membrane protein OmpA-like peptidoglycan-associated protein